MLLQQQQLQEHAHELEMQGLKAKQEHDAAMMQMDAQERQDKLKYEQGKLAQQQQRDVIELDRMRQEAMIRATSPAGAQHATV